MDAIAFGRFRLLPRERQLLDGDQPVRLGGRAFDLLMSLVIRAGEVLTRAELEASVWKQTVVEETSLRVHIAALRKALGDGNGSERFILNVPGRGYSFVAPVTRHAELLASASAGARPHPLPVRLTRMIGRSSELVTLRELLSRQRMITIAGTGGMGKTTLAIAVAEELLPSFADGVCFVDLAPIASARLVPGAIATALGTATGSDDPVAALTAYMRGKQMLIVLDNCEHVVEMAAMMSETLQRNSRASVLATSREPLGAEGEWVYRLSSLETASPDRIITAQNATAYSSIDLFIDRARGHGHLPEISDESASAISEICRCLDGIPLAIELAAAHVQYLGVHELATRLDDRFALLTRGRRTAPLRHRTLSAMLDWSYELLSEIEQRVLRRLSTFRATFSVDSAVAVATDGAERECPDVVQAIMGLVAKSLIVADPTGPVVRYRLLETTRAYALRKLEGSGDSQAASRRHAIHMQELLTRAQTEWTTMSPAHWAAHYCQGMGDIRAALDWCFSDEGDTLLGIALTADSMLPMYELGFLLLHEYHQLVDRALACVQTLTPAQPALEMRLKSALCLRNWATTGSARELLRLAEQDGEPRHRVTALYGAWVSALGAGDYRLSREASSRIRQIGERSRDDATDLLCDRLSTLTSHFLGEHEAARALANRALRQPPTRMPLGYSSPIPLEVLMRIVLARVHYLLGQFDQAVLVADRCVDEAAGAHPIALIQALAVAAIPIACWRGDRDRARTLVDRLAEVVERHGSDYWRSFVARFREALAARGWADMDDRPENSSVGAIRAANALEADCISTLVDRWITPESQARAESGEAGWCAPEILRNVGEKLRAAGSDQDAETKLLASLAMARRQGALAWQLRTATSLAGLWAEQGRAAEARALLSDVLGELHEGLDTADPLRARHLLGQLEASP